MDISTLSLRGWFDGFYAPLFLIEARPNTFVAYAATLNHLERICKDVPMDRIGTLTLTLPSFSATTSFLSPKPCRPVSWLGMMMSCLDKPTLPAQSCGNLTVLQKLVSNPNFYRRIASWRRRLLQWRLVADS